MDIDAIRQVRSFNRTVAERIGAVNDRFLGCGRAIGESRLLWEIGPDGVDVRTLRGRLGLDSGYLSRVLHSLERQGLVKVSASRDDRRVRRVRLTRSGLRERTELDQRSNALAARILDALSDHQRGALITAMQQLERLLEASMVSFAIEDPGTADARWCLDQYAAELNARFDSGFDPARSLPAEAHEITLTIARLRGRPIGCGALKLHGRKPAELKRMWIAPEARGLGVGRRLLAELERNARERSVPVIRLETNRSLTEAIALYRRSGYREVAPFSPEPYAHHWFEKRLTTEAGSCC